MTLLEKFLLTVFLIVGVEAPPDKKAPFATIL